MEAGESMKKNGRIQLKPNKKYPVHLGAIVTGEYIEFTVQMKHKECGVILHTKGDAIKIPFTQECRMGNVYSGILVGISSKDIEGYQYYEQDSIFVDSYAKKVLGNECFGQDYEKEKSQERIGAIVGEEFVWGEDRNPCYSYEDSIQYMLHVRGFTQHSSANVEANGTFQGIMEKIPYLLELGITTLEVMPCYEFEEVETLELMDSMAYALKHYKEEYVEQPKKKLNCWGYKQAYYFAPKRSYSYKEDCVLELKELIKQLHGVGIEFIMQVYFPKECTYQLIYDVLSYWMMEYHVDGFHVMGEAIPMEFLAKEPIFQDLKMMCDHVTYDAIAHGPGFSNHIATYHGAFMKSARRFLKGEPESIGSFVEALKLRDNRIASIQYVSNYNEFTLHDMVSYDHKHNEDNGEGNEDGTYSNYSWNHGIEGVTDKKKILDLRKKQMKNIMAYLLLSQGTPMIMAGDEFAFSRKGNNNPYCHDNELLWLDWNGVHQNNELFTYSKSIIAFRKEHPIFHPSHSFKMVDTIGCGCPELSYHGEDAWKPNMGTASFCIGLLYSGAYQKKEIQEEKPDYYIAFNSHWQKHLLALPRLKNEYRWSVVMDTYEPVEEENKNYNFIEGDTVQVGERSVLILKSVLLNEN